MENASTLLGVSPTLVAIQERFEQPEAAMSYLKKIDHVSYAVEEGNIEKWAWFHIEVEGGTLIKRIDDARPSDPNSSMKIWCIDYGDFGIALIEGIDRAEKSQVTSFVEKHGDHSCQRCTALADRLTSVASCDQVMRPSRCSADRIAVSNLSKMQNTCV